MGDRERIETMVLRQQAVEACARTGHALITEPPGPTEGWRVESWDVVFSNPEATGNGDTEADALRAFLRDIGVEPVEWPDIEAGIAAGTTFRVPEVWRDLLARLYEEQGLLALLATLGLGGEA